MRCVRLLGAALVVAAVSVQAAPSDFARGSVLVPADSAAVQHVLLPADVYQWVMRDDLGDLRVFDGAGEEVAYALKRPARAIEHTPWRVLPMFELPKPDEVGGDPAGVNIELADGGAVVAVHGVRIQSSPGQRYLLDVSGYEEPLVELKFDWSGGADVVVHVQVEAADDLNDWRVLVASATLAELTAGSEQVRLDRVALPRPTRADYLRVTPVDGADFALLGVEVRSRETRAPDRRWHVLQGHAVDDGLEFDAGGRFPIDRVAVELDRDSYLIEVDLYSRADQDHPWRERGRRTFYRVATDGAAASSDPLKFASPYHRYWRVEMLGDPPDATPQLNVGWAPDRLIFATQGQGPYTLAYGRADTPGRQWPMRDLLHRLDPDQVIDDLPMARLAAPETLGGPARLEPAPEPVDWQTVMLWAVLVAGVLVIGTLAIRLLRQ